MKEESVVNHTMINGFWQSLLAKIYERKITSSCLCFEIIFNLIKNNQYLYFISSVCFSLSWFNCDDVLWYISVDSTSTGTPISLATENDINVRATSRKCYFDRTNVSKGIMKSTIIIKRLAEWFVSAFSLFCWTYLLCTLDVPSLMLFNRLDLCFNLLILWRRKKTRITQKRGTEYMHCVCVCECEETISNKSSKNQWLARNLSAHLFSDYSIDDWMDHTPERAMIFNKQYLNVFVIRCSLR